MDPSRIRLEDDRFGLIGVSFRPQNRATFLGTDGGDYVWSIGIVVGDEDEIQTVEIDEHGAKSSRMLTPGELFEGLEILAAPGSEAYLIVGALTLLGMDLRASGSETARQFADVLRAAADDRGWRLPLHLIGQPRDLQLSSQGREILRQTATTLERDGQARTSLAAAQRLELSGNALDSVRRRIARKSLQAYRMHGRWYVVLDNLTRSRASEQNGTHEAALAPSPAPESASSPFEEMPEGEPAAEIEEAATGEASVEAPFVPVEEAAELAPEEIAAAAAAPRAGEAPTEEELTAFVSEEAPTEPGAPAAEPAADVSAAAAGATPSESADQYLLSEAAAEERAAREALAREAGFYADTRETTPQPEAELEPAPSFEQETAIQEPEAPAEPLPAELPAAVDRFISETVLEQVIITQVDTFVRETRPETEMPAVEAGPVEEPSAPETDETARQAISDEEPELESLPEAEAVLAAEPAETVEGAPVTTGEPEISPEAGLAEEPVESVTVQAAPEAETPAMEAAPPAADWSEEAAGAESVVSETTRSVPQPEPEPAAMAEAAEARITEAAETTEAQIEEPAAPQPETTEALEESGPVEAGELRDWAGVAAEIEPEQESVQREAPAETESVTNEEPVESTAAAESTVESEEEAEAAEVGPEETEQPAGAPQLEIDESALSLLAHLRSEVAFLRQQGQEKDRQIVAWINGAQWLQPFVDQIHSLEQQVERLGGLQTQRDAERITDLTSERDDLRERLAQLETKIESARAAEAAPARRSWFRRMMSSE